MRYCGIVILFFLSFSGQSQSVFSKAFTIQTTADLLTSDALGNIYIINGSEIVKYNEKGQICCTFSNRNFGAITSIDARDPLRILLFYKPFSMVILLDNNLTEQTSINLNSLEIYDPLLVCNSETQGIWVYDNATARLYKFDSKLQAVGLSNDLQQDVMKHILPIMMTESDYWLVILEKENLLVFDKMGNYFKSIHLGNHNGGQLPQ